MMLHSNRFTAAVLCLAHRRQGLPLLLLLLFAAASGCRLPGGEYVPVQYYRFSPATTPVALQQPRQRSLAFANFRVQGPYTAPMIYLKSANHIVRDDYNRWIMPPETLAANSLYHALVAANVFTQVLPSTSRHAELQLSGTLLALEVTPDLQAHLQLFLQLNDIVGNKIVLSKIYRQHIPLRESSPEAFAEAAGIAITAIAADLIADILQQLPE